MDETAINKEFSASMRMARELHKKRGEVGFQAKMCAEGLFTPSNFSQIINNDKGTKEPRRRIAVDRVTALIPDFPAKTYEEFLRLGRWILDGNDPEKWRPIPEHLLDKYPSEMTEKELDLVANSINQRVKTLEQSFNAQLKENEQWHHYALGSQANITPYPSDPGSARKIPVISWVQAGEWSEVVDLYQPGFADEWIFFDERCGPNTFALVVDGESMSPDFTPGMRIIVDPSLQVENGDLVIVKNGSNEATFKKIVFERERVFLYPLNEKFLPPREITGKEFHVIGVVVGRYESLRWSRRR